MLSVGDWAEIRRLSPQTQPSAQSVERYPDDPGDLRDDARRFRVPLRIHAEPVREPLPVRGIQRDRRVAPVVRASLADTSRMTNRNAHVVNGLSPRKSPGLAKIASMASAAAWCATSSSSGPVTGVLDARSRTSASAMRTSLAYRSPSAACRSPLAVPSRHSQPPSPRPAPLPASCPLPRPTGYRQVQARDPCPPAWDASPGRQAARSSAIMGRFVPLTADPGAQDGLEDRA